MKPVTVASLMKTSVICANPHASLLQARNQMAEAGVRHLAVTDEKRHLVGILSQHDLNRALDVAQAAEGMRQTARVGDVMKTQLYKTSPSTPAQEAAAIMLEHKISSLPVVDENAKLVGVLTETDFVEVARDYLRSGDAPRAGMSDKGR